MDWLHTPQIAAVSLRLSDEAISYHWVVTAIMCHCWLQALLAEQESGTSAKGQTLTEQILQIMETILLEASAQPHDTYKVVISNLSVCLSVISSMLLVTMTGVLVVQWLGHRTFDQEVAGSIPGRGVVKLLSLPSLWGR